jgi:hypothetical protein
MLVEYWRTRKNLYIIAVYALPWRMCNC